MVHLSSPIKKVGGNSSWAALGLKGDMFLTWVYYLGPLTE